MFTLEELRKIDIEKIKKELIDMEKTLYKSRFEVKTGQSKNHHTIEVNKRYIARMKTILTERKEEVVKKPDSAPEHPAERGTSPETAAPKKPKKTKKTKATPKA